MSVLESTLHKECNKFLLDLKRRGRKIHFIKNHGNQFTTVGTPDMTVCLDGKLFMVELKTATGVVAKAQIQQMKEWAAAGAVVGVVRSVEDLRILLAI